MIQVGFDARTWMTFSFLVTPMSLQKVLRISAVYPRRRRPVCSCIQ